MATDVNDVLESGLLVDKFGRRQYVLAEKHQAPVTGDLPQGSSLTDADGREQIVLLGPDGRSISSRMNTVESSADPAGDPPSAVLRTAAPFVTGRFRLRDRWSVGDFGAKGAGGDYTTQLQTAILEARAASRVLHAAEGVYGVSGTLTGSETTALALKGAGKGATIFQHAITAAPMFSAAGSIVAATTLSAPAARGASIIPVVSTAGLAAGNLVVLRDPTQAILGNNDNSQAAAVGGMARIKSVDSPTQITIRGRLSWALTSGSDVRKITLVDRISLSDFSIVNPAPGTMASTARGVLATYAHRVEIDRLEFQDMDAAGVYLQTCRDFRVTGADFYDSRDLETANAPYSIIATQGTSHGLVYGVKQRYGRHLFTTGPQSSGLETPVQRILVASCIATEMTQAAFDTHPGSRWINFADCQAQGCESYGFQLRGPDQSITNPLVDGATTGVLIVDGADRARVSGGHLFNCDVGMEIQDSDDVRARGVEIDSPITTGVLVDESASYSGHMTSLKLRDIEVRGNPSGQAFDFSSVWRDGFDVAGLRAPDATNKIAGGVTTPKLYGLYNDGFAGVLAPSIPAGTFATIAMVANQAWIARFVTQRNITITQLAYAVTTAAGADDAVDVGIYSLNASTNVITKLASLGATTGLLNSTGRKVVTVASTKLVAGTVYYVALSCGTLGGTAAVIAGAGLNNTSANQIMGTQVPNQVAGSKATSHPLPATISGPSQQLVGPMIGLLE